MGMLFDYLHILAAGLLIGKVALMSFVVAPIIARTLDAESFSKVARRLFPAYYLLGLVSAAIALASLMGLALLESGGPMIVFAMTLWAGVLASEWYCRFSVTPRSNAMRDRLKEQDLHGLVDSGLREVWERLHRQSVSLNSAVLSPG